jgi:hypothetical protein
MGKLDKVEFVKIFRLFSVVNVILQNALVYLLVVPYLVLISLLPVLRLMLYHIPARGSQLKLLVRDGAKAGLVQLDILPGIEDISVAVKRALQILVF